MEIIEVHTKSRPSTVYCGEGAAQAASEYLRGAQAFVEQLRRLMPRLYSISSSPNFVGKDSVHLTVAVVRYETNGRKRDGVCSTFLGEYAKVGETTLPVFVSNSHFGPPTDPDAPMIMVGPGTGIAPFRSFVQDRAAKGAKGKNWLFFGDQRVKTDFLYRKEWEDALASGLLTRLDCAWSRDQDYKIYVQDKIREAGDLPPPGTIPGIGIATEGILTLSRVRRALEEGVEDLQTLPLAARVIIEKIHTADRIEFYVGTKVNEAHQDPNLPAELDLRRNVIHRIADLLTEKYRKQTLLRWF